MKKLLSSILRLRRTPKVPNLAEFYVYDRYDKNGYYVESLKIEVAACDVIVCDFYTNGWDEKCQIVILQHKETGDYFHITYGKAWRETLASVKQILKNVSPRLLDRVFPIKPYNIETKKELEG